MTTQSLRRHGFIHNKAGGLLIAAGLVLALTGAMRGGLVLLLPPPPAEADLPFDRAPEGFAPLLEQGAGAQMGGQSGLAVDPALPRLLSRSQGETEFQAATLPQTGTAAEAGAPAAPQTLAPRRLTIPAISLDAPIVAVRYREVVYMGNTYRQWLAPNFFAAGWQATSAGLGAPGNTVLIGHHNVYGEVFRRLVDLSVGDFIYVEAEDGSVLSYQIVVKTILPERHQPIEVRVTNARWIESTPDERLTLITCWPYESNTHRLILVAQPSSAAPPESGTPPK